MHHYLSGMLIATGSLLTFINQAGTPVNCIAFHPNEPVVIWNGDQHIVVHSTKSNNTVKTISLPMQRVRDLAFDSNGKWLAISGGTPGEEGILLIIRWKDGEHIAHLEFDKEWLTTVGFSPNGEHLAVGSGDSTVSIFNIQTKPFSLSPTHTFEGHAGSVMDTTFDHSSDWLISTGSDRSVKVWNVDEKVLHRTFAHHTGEVFATSLRPVESDQGTLPFYVATASADQTVRIWQPEIGRMVRIVRNHDTDLFTVAYHPSGNWLASGGKDGTIRLINAQSDQILGTKRAHNDWIYALAFSSDGKLMASGDWSGEVAFHWVNDKGME